MAKAKAKKSRSNSNKRHNKHSKTNDSLKDASKGSSNKRTFVGVVVVVAVVLLVVSVAVAAASFYSFTSEESSLPFVHDNNNVNAECGFVMADSTFPNSGFGVFSMNAVEQYKPLLTGEPVIQLPNVLESQHAGLQFILHHYAWAAEVTGGQDEGTQQVMSIIPGLGMLANSHNPPNAVPDHPQLHHDGLVRGQSPAAGANTHYHNLGRYAYTHLQPGQEILIDYGRDWDHKIEKQLPPNTVRSTEWLAQHGICLDHMVPGKTEGRGHGAFAQRVLQKGQIIAPLPVVPIERSSLDMDQTVGGYQLLLNYCYGHANSSLLLFPYSPVVNLLNHDAEAPNALLRWSSKMTNQEEWFQMSAAEVLQQRRSGILLELVATRTILPGQEVRIDYGTEYQTAWQKHVDTFEPTTQDDSSDYMYAFEANEKWKVIKTIHEQATEPYPANLQTSCLHRYASANIHSRELQQQQHPDNNDNNNDGTAGTIITTTAHFVMDRSLFQPHNLRPCRILQRESLLSDGKHYQYTVEVLNRPRGMYVAADAEHIPENERHIVQGMPREALYITDVPGTTDQHLPNAFRHVMGLPEGVFPEAWMDLVV